MVEIVFWGSALLVGYAYVGYPMLVWCAARLFPRPVRTAPITPLVTVLIAARNEADRIGAKIENCLGLDYPADRLEVVVVSDGSQDRTADVVRGYAARSPQRVRLVELPARRGKAAALNAGAAVATGDVLLLTDTRQRLAPEVARTLVRNLADPSVGAVSGELVLYASEAGSTPVRDVGLYWRYEKMIRKAESQFGSSIGYTGAIAAVRRRLFPTLPEDTLVDDLVVPLTILSRGSRVVFEPAAQASDAIAADRRAEFRRKVRTLAGVLQTFLHMRRFAGPLPGLVWWQFVSHKLLRLAVPFALLACLGASAWLSGPFYRAAFAAQLVVYALGVLGLVVTGRGPLGRVISLPATLLLLNAAAVAGTIRYLSGGRLELWDSGIATARQAA